MVGLPPFTRRLYVGPPNRRSEWYQRRWMTHAENGELWLGLQFPKGHLPRKQELLDRPFVSWPELRNLNPMGNHALLLTITNKNKLAWNSHHLSLLLISQVLELCGLTYRFEWETAIDTANPELGRFFRDHAVMTYIRFGTPRRINASFRVTCEDSTARRISSFSSGVIRRYRTLTCRDFF